jgi:hypothetical protein
LPNDTCQTPPISAPLADPDLAAVVDAWPALPEAIKAGILAMVKVAKTRKPYGTIASNPAK